MKEETLNYYMDRYYPLLKEDFTDKRDKCAQIVLKGLIREVERDTRHAICDAMKQAANDMHKTSI